MKPINISAPVVYKDTFKIDTQGMSYGTGKGTGKSIEEQRAALPDVEPKKINIISDALKEELKQIINEVLDERIKHR